MAEPYLNLMLNIQQAQKKKKREKDKKEKKLKETPNRTDSKRNTPRYFIVKLMKQKQREF